MKEMGYVTLNESGDSFGELIREYRKKKKMTQEQLGSLVQVKKNAVGAWEAGRSRPDLASVPVLCETLDIPLHIFFGMPQEMEHNPVMERYNRLSPYHQQIVMNEMDMLFSLQKEEEATSPRRIIPLYLNDLSAAAGPVSYLGDCGGETIFLYDDGITSRADEIIRVSGDSMEPTFHDGDRVLVQHTDRIRPGEIGIFINGDSGYIKEYRRDGLYSHNSKYSPIRFNEEDSVRCVGRVLGKLHPDLIASKRDVNIFRSSGSYKF